MGAAALAHTPCSQLRPQEQSASFWHMSSHAPVKLPEATSHVPPTAHTVPEKQSHCVVHGSPVLLPVVPPVPVVDELVVVPPVPVVCELVVVPPVPVVCELVVVPPMPVVDELVVVPPVPVVVLDDGTHSEPEATGPGPHIHGRAAAVENARQQRTEQEWSCSNAPEVRAFTEHGGNRRGREVDAAPQAQGPIDGSGKGPCRGDPGAWTRRVGRLSRARAAAPAARAPSPPAPPAPWPGTGPAPRPARDGPPEAARASGSRAASRWPRARRRRAGR